MGIINNLQKKKRIFYVRKLHLKKIQYLNSELFIHGIFFFNIDFKDGVVE